jgi:p24 family protein alpha
MEPRLSRQPWLSAAIVYFLLAFLAAPARALYFHMENGKAKCFHEELPKDTLVVGKQRQSSRALENVKRLTSSLHSGHFNAQQWNDQMRSYMPDNNINIYISVEEVFDNYHRVVSQRGDAKGRFTFSAADSGEHRICFTPTNGPGHGGWLSNGEPTGGIQFDLDMAIGETSNIESTDKSKIDDIVSKVKNLNGRLHDIKREQVFQRVSRLAKGQHTMRIANIGSSGARGRVQGSVGSHKRQGGAVVAHPAGGARRYVRVAAFSSPSVLHQAEAHLGFSGLCDRCLPSVRSNCISLFKIQGP